MLLSVDEQRKRGRQFVVGIQMTVISWCLEFVAGVFIMIMTACAAYGFIWVPGLWISDICVSFIVIPASYLFNNEINKSLIVVDGWCRGISRAISPHQPCKAENPMELQSIPPKILSSSDNAISRAQTSTHIIHVSRRKSFAGCITKETNLSIGKSKRNTVKSQADSLNPPRLESPARFTAAESHLTEGEEDIEAIPSDHLTVAEMLNADTISTMPGNNWM